MLPSPESDLSPASLRAVAAHFARLAKAYSDAAARVEAIEPEEIRALRQLADRRDYLHRVPELIAAQIEQGFSLDEAVATAQQLTGMDESSIRYRWRVRQLERRRTDIAWRRGQVIQLTNKGLNTDQIGAKLGLHRNSVARILRRLR